MVKDARVQSVETGVCQIGQGWFLPETCQVHRIVELNAAVWNFSVEALEGYGGCVARFSVGLHQVVEIDGGEDVAVHCQECLCQHLSRGCQLSRSAERLVGFGVAYTHAKVSAILKILPNSISKVCYT